MPVSPEDAGREVQRFISGLNASKNNAREKSIKSFRAFVEKQGLEFFDDDVDTVLLGDGYALGITQWCGESSTGTHGALKRTAAIAISTLKWLVSLQDSSSEENIFLARFLQVAVEDLQKMKLDLHIRPNQRGTASRSGKSEDACELLSLILQRHRNDAGEPEDVALEELLQNEEARKIFMEWLKQTAMGKQAIVPSTGSKASDKGQSPVEDGNRASVSGVADRTRGGNTSDEDMEEYNDEDAPLTWAEVDQDQFIVSDERTGSVVPVDMAQRMDEPVPDPLGLKKVDLRLYQKALVEDDTSAIVAVDGGNGEGPATLQAKKRALLGQRDRLKLLKRMQTGKERLQRNMDKGWSSEMGKHLSGHHFTARDAGLGMHKISGSVVPTTDKFDPALFMAVIHSTASFNDIHDGLGRLKSAKANQASELQRLVRDHFDNFVRCADSVEKYASQIEMELSNTKEKPKVEAEPRPKNLAHLRMQLKAEREAEAKRMKEGGGPGGVRGGAGPAAKSHLKELTRLMEGAQAEAGKNFNHLLRKLDKIKQVRAAQHLLAEKGSILDIPRDMSSCMMEGRYPDLVKLYKKAHTTYSSTILSQVRNEAEVVGKQACSRLMEVVRSPDISLEEQIEAIGHLQDLEYDGEGPLQACFDSQRDHFLNNVAQCWKAFSSLLQETYSQGRKAERETSGKYSGSERLNRNERDLDFERRHLIAQSGRTAPKSPHRLLSLGRSLSEELTDPEDMSPIASGGGYMGGGVFFDLKEENLLLALDADDDESSQGNIAKRDDEGRGELIASRAKVGHELEGMDLDEDLVLPVPTGVELLEHRLSVARLQHMSNLAGCLGSWLPHLVSLSVYLIRQEQSRGGTHDEEEKSGNQDVSITHASAPVHIRLLQGSSTNRGGISDYGETDTASFGTSGHRGGTASVQEGGSVSEDSFAMGKREQHHCTQAEKVLTNIFKGWLDSTTVALRAAIFGDDPAATSVVVPTADDGDVSQTKSKSTVVATSMRVVSGSSEQPIFPQSLQASLPHFHKDRAELNKSLDPRYLQHAFASLARLYDSLSEVLGESWEGDVILTPGLRSLEKLVKEAQTLYVRSEMSALAKEVGGLADAEGWTPPDPPHQSGGTNLPHSFSRLTQQRMQDLVDLLPRAEWSAAEVTNGLGGAVKAFLDCIMELSSRAYESSPAENHLAGAATVVGGAGGGTGIVQEGLPSADQQLLYQIGNCLQLDAVVLPELWEMAVTMFDASRAGVGSDKKQTRKIQDKVMTKYLKRKYRELKMYIKNGWWGHAKLMSKSTESQKGGSEQRGSPLSCRTLDLGGSTRELRRTSTTIARQRTSLHLKRANNSSRSVVGSVAAVARQASMLAPTNTNTSTRQGSSPPLHSASRRESVENRRTGMKAALQMPVKALKTKSLPSYLVKVLLSLVQARLEAQEALSGLLYRKAGLYDGKQRKDILYADYVLRESARQVMEIVCDCANARVVGKGHLGVKPLDGSDPVEQAEKIAQVEFLRDALFRYLPSSTMDRVDRVITRLQTGTFERNSRKSNKVKATKDNKEKLSGNLVTQATLEAATRGTGLMRSVKLASSITGESSNRDSSKPKEVTNSRPASVSDSLGAAMPGSFLTATNLQELARVYVVCLK